MKKYTQKSVYIETYGCQMNLADTEVILGLVNDAGYIITNQIEEADFILINTCSVRENAEQRIYGRLGKFKSLKKKKPEIVIGMLGCMAERLRSKLMYEKAKGVGQAVDVLVGPDEYRKLPELMNHAWQGEKGIAVKLSRFETYDDITPLRTNGISAWISVMRGCDKFCSFCVVPFTRGRERCRPLASIVKEVETLSSRGFKEVTLLGQNVNSYIDRKYDFADLLKSVADVDSSIRVRFTTSHPQDMSDKLIETIAEKRNICKYIHLPLQSASDRILNLMNRSYDCNHYLNLIAKIRSLIPNTGISTDIITGFPTETEEDHRKTIEVLSDLQFDGAFMFKYSPRENTLAYKMIDDIPDEIKSRRIDEIIKLQNMISLEKNRELVGQIQEILVEGDSKKSLDKWHGRTDSNKMVIFSKDSVNVGDYVKIKIEKANSATLFGSIIKNIEHTMEITL